MKWDITKSKGEVFGSLTAQIRSEIKVNMSNNQSTYLEKQFHEIITLNKLMTMTMVIKFISKL